MPKLYAQEQNNKAVAALKADDLPNALSYADNAVKDDPAFVAARVNKANILARMQRFDEAVAVLDGGVANDPAIALAHSFRGIYLERAGKPEESKAAFAKAIAAYDAAVQAKRAQPEDLVARAIVAYLAGGQTKGLLAINDVIAQYPEFHRARMLRDRMLENDRAYFVRWMIEPSERENPQADAIARPRKEK